MTGYGASRARVRGGELSVEIRSVNGRFLEFRCSLPRELMVLETDVRDAVKHELKRGNVNVFVSYSTRQAGTAEIVDEARVRRAYTQLKRIAKSTGISAETTLDTLLRIVMLTENAFQGIEPEKLKRPLRTALQNALEGVQDLRAKEGEALERDLRKRSARIRREVDKIKQHAPEVVEQYTDRITRQLTQLAEQNGMTFDPVKVLTETGVFAERIDITEELTRIDSHLNQFDNAISKGGVIGKRLDFILQELFRETNTAGNKANSAKVSEHIVVVKEELEKMREQVQNIE